MRAKAPILPLASHDSMSTELESYSLLLGRRIGGIWKNVAPLGRLKTCWRKFWLIECKGFESSLFRVLGDALDLTQFLTPSEESDGDGKGHSIRYFPSTGGYEVPRCRWEKDTLIESSFHPLYWTAETPLLPKTQEGGNPLSTSHTPRLQSASQNRNLPPTSL